MTIWTYPGLLEPCAHNVTAGDIAPLIGTDRSGPWATPAPHGGRRHRESLSENAMAHAARSATHQATRSASGRCPATTARSRAKCPQSRQMKKARGVLTRGTDGAQNRGGDRALANRSLRA